MNRSLKRKIAAGAGATLAAAGGGVAIAATQAGSPSEESEAVLNDAAEQLGIQPSRLSDALEKALANRVDAAVAAGELTRAQGDAIKARLQSGELPLFGGRHGGFGHLGHLRGFGHLDDAAAHLGLTVAELRTELEAGKTLAQSARDHGKSVDGLVQALVDAERKEVDAAVAAGRLTDAQRQSILSNLEQRIGDLVNGRGFRGLPGGRGLGPSPGGEAEFPAPAA
ncbi:MAG: hypothetical protein ACRDN6_05970 [Gaiellaceae bacterium]